MFNPTKAKVQLKLSVNRLQMLQNKKNMLAQQQRKEIARLLEAGKEESARIRVTFVSVVRVPMTPWDFSLPDVPCCIIGYRWSISFARISPLKHWRLSSSIASCSWRVSVFWSSSSMFFIRLRISGWVGRVIAWERNNWIGISSDSIQSFVFTTAQKLGPAILLSQRLSIRSSTQHPGQRSRNYCMSEISWPPSLAASLQPMPWRTRTSL